MKTRVALVDDDRNILISLEHLLIKEDFDIQTYPDGQSALACLLYTSDAADES